MSPRVDVVMSGTGRSMNENKICKMDNGKLQTHRTEVWASGADYEPYVGRWSRLVVQEFLKWLAVPPGSRWLDVGCGRSNR